KYNNRTLDGWMEQRQVGYHLEVSSRPAGQQGFVPLKVRWVVERTFAWLGRYRRLSTDYEYETAHSEAWIQVSSIRLRLRHLRPNAENPDPKCKDPKSQKKVA